VTQPNLNQPNLQIDHGNKQRILHQLYNLAITTSMTGVELENYWETLAHEEEREITRGQRQRVGNLEKQ
jgi:hypothetical protein